MNKSQRDQVRRERKEQEDAAIQDYIQNSDVMTATISGLGTLSMTDDEHPEGHEKLKGTHAEEGVFDEQFIVKLDGQDTSDDSDSEGDNDFDSDGNDLSDDFDEEDEDDLEDDWDDSLDDDPTIPNDDDAGPSRTQLRKQRNREQKEKRVKLMDDQKARKDESQAANLALMKSGAALSKNVLKFIRNWNHHLHDFVLNGGDSLILPQMMAPLRKISMKMASKYGLETSKRGKGNEKLIIVYRTDRCRVPPDWEQIADTCAQQQEMHMFQKLANSEKKRDKKRDKKERKAKDHPWSSHHPNQGKAPKGKKKASNKEDQFTVASRPKQGEVVAEHAPVIQQDNVGHKMMMAMGWKPGEGLGSKVDGIVEPIKAVIRSKHGGLGTE